MSTQARRPGGIPKSWIIGTIAAAIVVVGTIVAISARGGDSTPDQLVGVDEAKALFAGLPQSGQTLGKPDAPVQIWEFADVQCPFCADASKSAIPQLVEKYVRPGDARLVMYPVAILDSAGDAADSERGARMLFAAAAQNKLWETVDVLFANQGAEHTGWLKDSVITDVATAVGLDTSKLDSERKNGTTKDELTKAMGVFTAEGLQSTPSFLVRGPKGQVAINDYRNIAEFDAAVAAVT